MKKILTRALAVLLTAFVLSGCGNSGATTVTTVTTGTTATTAAPTETEATEATTVAEAPETNMYGWAKPAKTTVIDFYQADKDNPDNVAKNTKMLHDYILDQFNVDLQKTVFDVDPNEKLNLMLASNDYPPMILAMSRDTVAKWGELGKVIDLKTPVETYAPGLKKTIGSLYGLYLDAENHLYGLPRGWGYLGIPDNSAHIRWDWYTAMGSPKIETPEDYYNVLKQMVADHPTNANGEKVYAISWSTDQVKISQVLGFWGLKDGYKEDAANNLTHWVNTAEGLEAIKYYNKFYREGLLDPEAFVNKYDDWKAKFSSERIAGHIGGWWQSWNAGHEVWQKQEANLPEDKRYVQISFKAPGVTTAYLSPKNTLGWNYSVITDKCPAEDVEAILKFWEFSASPMGTRLFGWGVPNLPESGWNTDGQTYTFNDTIKKYVMAGTYDKMPNWSLNGNGQYFLGQGQKLTEDAAPSTVWYDQNFNTDPAPEAKWRRIMNENMAGTIYDNTAASTLVFAPDNPLTIKNQQIEDALMPGMVKAILSKTEAECIANFNELKNTLTSLGIADIEKFRTDEYKKNLAQMAAK